jgi:hypothetical protein
MESSCPNLSYHDSRLKGLWKTMKKKLSQYSWHWGRNVNPAPPEK